MYQCVESGLRRILACVAVAGTLFCSARSYASPSNDDVADKAAIQDLLTKVYDIDLARSLTPLKLTGSQVDKLVELMDATTKETDKNLDAARSELLKPLAAEITKQYKLSLADKEPTADFDNKIKKIMGDFAKKQDSLRQDAILTIAGGSKRILTKDQYQIAVQMEKDTLAKLGRTKASGTDEQFYNLYCLDVFVNYGHIVPLLKAIKAGGA